jgi:predicted regulator of Ras-like GTPase activity (Roadblock/LC7/MglB family)
MSRINDEVGSILRSLAMDIGNGIVGAMLIYRNGFIISSVSRNSVNMKSLGAVLAAIKGSVDKMLGRAGLGSSDLIVTRAGEYILIITPVNQSTLLISILRELTDLGLALLVVENAREKIGKVIQ